MNSELPLVVAISGASGAVYAVRLVNVLLSAGRTVLLTISPAGQQVVREELGVDIDLEQFNPEDLFDVAGSGKLEYFHFRNYLSPIASGSHLTGGMVICPCSGSTLSAIAHAGSNNLIQRAADVHLKERRKLILVPRETPLSLPQLENMQRACQAGAVILPAMPGWYHGVHSLDDLVDFMVARMLDQLNVPHTLMQRWGSQEK